MLVSLCIRELSVFMQGLPYVTVVCKVQERQISLGYVCQLWNRRRVWLSNWHQNIYQCEWMAYMFALMVLYFAPPFLTREETFHTESVSSHTIDNYKGAIKLWLLWGDRVFLSSTGLIECFGRYVFMMAVGAP